MADTPEGPVDKNSGVECTPEDSLGVHGLKLSNAHIGLLSPSHLSEDRDREDAYQYPAQDAEELSLIAEDAKERSQAP